MKDRLAAFVDRAVARHPLVRQHEDDIAYLTSVVELTGGATLRHHPEIEEAVRLFRRRSGFSAPVDSTLASDDVMFRHLLRRSNDVRNAMLDYLLVGFDGRNIVVRLLESRFDEAEAAGAVLDFGSGFGRVSRLLLHDLPPTAIWVADVKAAAVEFQTEHFGVQGLVSSFVPEDFGPDRTFDLIFVGSLFTHLPEDLFHRWLGQLYGLVSGRGVLAFTVRSARGPEEVPPCGIGFQPTSEETHFGQLPSAIRADDSYGSTRVTESFVREAAARLGPGDVARFPSAFGSQDLFVIGRSDEPIERSLPLRSCLHPEDAG